jgi:hypothetical protein
VLIGRGSSELGKRSVSRNGLWSALIIVDAFPCPIFRWIALMMFVAVSVPLWARKERLFGCQK